MKIKRFTKISEWIAAGAMASGLYMLEQQPVSETEKALAFNGTRFTAAGNPTTGKVWLPKSQLQKVTNDFYADSMGAQVFLVPGWLLEKNGLI